MPTRHRVTYVTSNANKHDENRIFADAATFSDGVLVSDLFEFEIRPLQVSELLEIDIRVMVQAEVTKAYSQIRVPCIVEHAGLIFDQYLVDQYPGGLTKPMWNALGQRFVDETKSANRPVTARAVVAYCDGMSVRTFVGETKGIIADKPRGSRQFYWDSVFIPEGADAALAGKTYSEIVDDPAFGLAYKVLRLSQSSRAMLKFLDYLRTAPPAPLWA